MPEVNQDLIDELVNNSHGNLPRVREILREHPELLEARSRLDESPLGAASHVGNREVAEVQLAEGAPLDVCTAAMLGRRDEVAAMLERDPALAGAKGAHGISLLFHAALSGDVEIAELLAARGAVEGIDQALHAAVGKGHRPMVAWLLDHGASDLTVKNYQGKTPLQVATELGHGEIAELLRSRGAAE